MVDALMFKHQRRLFGSAEPCMLKHPLQPEFRSLEEDIGDYGGSAGGLFSGFCRGMWGMLKINLCVREGSLTPPEDHRHFHLSDTRPVALHTNGRQ